MRLATPPTASRRTQWLLFPEPLKKGDDDGQWGRSARLCSLDIKKKVIVRQVDLPYLPSTQLLDNDSIDLRPLFVQENWKYVSTRGWLVYVDENLHDITLVHTVSNEIIACPPIPFYLSQELSNLRFPPCHHLVFALSDAPSTGSPYSLSMISIGYNSVAVWSSTENEWLVRKFPDHQRITDVAFFNGYLYFVNALFLGHNSGFSIKTSNCYNVQSNCIYYVGDSGVSKDMGIYDLSPRKINENHYYPSDLGPTIFPPPVWVESTLHDLL